MSSIEITAPSKSNEPLLGSNNDGDNAAKADDADNAENGAAGAGAGTTGVVQEEPVKVDPLDGDGPATRYLTGEPDDTNVAVKRKKKRRKPRAEPKKKDLPTLDDIEKRLAKSHMVATEKKSCKDVRIAIDPRSTFMGKWDVTMMLCLLFTALVTPYEIAFLASDDPGIPIGDPLYWINRIVDLLFFIDMFINFFLAFFDPKEGQWIFVNGRIARKYLKGWFPVDLVSILPYESFGLIFNSDSLGSLKILRVVRLLRLIKLVRVFRASRLIKRFEMSMEMSYSNLSLLKFLVLVFISVHWIACAWQLGPQLEDGEISWLKSIDHDTASLHEAPPADRFVACVYVAIIALPMGVGDIVPVTTAERVLCIFIMLIGGSIYAYVIGAICGVVSTRDPATTEFHQTMDHLNTFLAEIKTPQQKRREIREYFHHCRQLFRSQYYNNLLVQMSPKLRGDIALHSHATWVSQISFFRAESLEERDLFITAIALSLKLEAYAPKELIIKTGEFTEKMYIIQRGLVARLGRVLGAGRFFGEDVILHNSRRNYFVRVLTYLDVYSLSKEDLEDILTNGDFPQTRKIIRKSAIRLALTREFCRIADQVRMAKMLGRRLSSINLPNQLVQGAISQNKASAAGELAPMGTTVSKEPAGRRRSVVAEQSDVVELAGRMSRLESTLDSIVATVNSGFEQLKRVQVEPFAPYTPLTGATTVSANAGMGAGPSQQRHNMLSPLAEGGNGGSPVAPAPAAGAGAGAGIGAGNAGGLWDAMEEDHKSN